MHTFVDGELLTAAALNDALTAAKTEAIKEADNRYTRIDLTPTDPAPPTAYLVTDGVRCTLTMGHWSSSMKQPVNAYQTINAWQLPKKYAPANDVATHISYGLGIVNVTASGVIELYAAKDIAKNNTLAINLTWIAGL
jgi:hypothetical protein